jgi:hypothetical protein
MFAERNDFSVPAEQAQRPTLSLILCSRNDQYMGNSRWRLQTALNYVARNVERLGRENDVEVLVADWGSEVPLREVLELSPAAARITSFILIPPKTAQELQQDSPFAEVFALNAAARRARGEYIGRIDQDTLVGKRFLEVLFDLHEGRLQLEAPLRMGFANLKMITYRFAVRCPSLLTVRFFVNLFWRFLKKENSRSRGQFYFAGVGIWLLHRDLWVECGGYDERMIYMNAMETNMILRLLPKYEMVNLGKLSDYDFYHLEHYHPWSTRKSSVHRKVNPHLPFSQPDAMNPNGESWGLSEYGLQVVPAKPATANPQSANSVVTLLSFLQVMARAGPLMTFDWIGLAVKRQYSTWKHRAMLAWHTVEGQSVLAWPKLLMKLWNERSIAQLR